MTSQRSNREISKFMNSAPAATANLIDIQEPTDTNGANAIIAPGAAAFLSFLAGVGIGQAGVGHGWNWLTGVSMAHAGLAFGGSFAAATFIALYVVTLAYGGTRYYIERERPGEAVPSPAAAFIATERKGQRVKVPGRMRGLLTTFATYYDEVGGTTGIGTWYRSGHLTRSDIESVRNYLVRVGAARRDDNNHVLLTDWTVSHLPRWKNGDFEGMIELLETSPAPGGAE